MTYRSMNAVARTVPWRQNGAMPSVQIKNVPPEIHAVLVRRAEAAHQSLQEYLRSRLIAEAAVPTMEEWLNVVTKRSRSRLTPAEAAQLVRAARDSR